MNITVPYLCTVLRALLVTLWTPAIVLASTVSLQKTIDGVSIGVFMLLGIFSTLASGTALLNRIDKELRAAPGTVLPRPWLLSSSHMTGGWLAGALAFMLAEGSGVLIGFYELAFVTAASFYGARFVDLVVEKFLLKRLP